MGAPGSGPLVEFPKNVARVEIAGLQCRRCASFELACDTHGVWRCADCWGVPPALGPAPIIGDVAEPPALEIEVDDELAGTPSCFRTVPPTPKGVDYPEIDCAPGELIDKPPAVRWRPSGSTVAIVALLTVAVAAGAGLPWITAAAVVSCSSLLYLAVVVGGLLGDLARERLHRWRLRRALVRAADQRRAARVFDWSRKLWSRPPLSARKCRECGCTDRDCSGCIARTGRPCWWVESDLCSACADGSRAR